MTDTLKPTVWSEPVLVETQKIFSIESESSLTGGFILGSGNINERKVFYYMVETDGALSMERIDYSDIVIKETDEEPHIEYYTQESLNKKRRTTLHTKVFFLPKNFQTAPLEPV